MPVIQELSGKTVVKRISDECAIHFNLEWAQHRCEENVYLMQCVVGRL